MVANPLGSHQQDLLKPQPLAFPPRLASNKNSVIVIEFRCRHVFKGGEYIIVFICWVVPLPSTSGFVESFMSGRHLWNLKTTNQKEMLWTWICGIFWKSRDQTK